MNSLLQDVMFVTGLIWWGVLCAAGGFFITVGAIEKVRRNVGARNAETGRRALSAVGDPIPSPAARSFSRTERTRDRSVAPRVDRRDRDHAGELTPLRLAPGSRLSTPTPFDGGAA